MGKKSKEAKRKEKKQRTGKKHLSLKPHEMYELSGETVTRKKRACPRCGPGTWLAAHKGREYCGKCGYTEFERRRSEHPGIPTEHVKPAGEPPKAEQLSKPEDSKPVDKPETPSKPEDTKPTDKPEKASQ